MKNIKISCIVPIYNSAESIVDTVNSILEQTYTNIEIILVDDGSTDKSNKIIDDLAKKDKRIKAIHKENGGVSSARNIGIKSSIGEYICFVDADDKIANNFLEECINIIKKYDCDIVRTNYYINSNKKEMINNSQLVHLTGNPNDNVFYELIKSYKYNSVWGQLIKRKCVTIPFNEKITMAEDFLFNYFLLKNCQNIYLLEKCLYHYTASTQGINYNKEYEKVLKKINSINEVYTIMLNDNFLNKELIICRCIDEILSQIVFLALNNYKIFKKAISELKKKLIIFKNKINFSTVRICKYKILFYLIKFNFIYIGYKFSKFVLKKRSMITLEN